MGNRVELGLQKNLSKVLFIGFNCQDNSILFEKKKNKIDPSGDVWYALEYPYIIFSLGLISIG